MAEATKFTKPLLLAGESGELFAQCSRWDDYLELVLPEGPGRDPAFREALCRIPSEAAGGSFDLRLEEGPPVRACVMVLYMGDPEERARPYQERLAGILSQLARAVPAFDFGELLPLRSSPAERPGVETGPDREAAAQLVAISPEPSPEGQLEQGSEAPEPQDLPGPASAAGNAGSNPMRPQLCWDVMLAQAREHASRGQLHKAERLLEEILHAYPNQPEAVQMKGQIKLLERREKKRKREPRNPQALLEVGFSYLVLERNGEAAEAFGQAVRASANLYLAQLLLGIALHREGKVADARIAYGKAERLRPGEDIHMELLAALERGEPPFPIMEAGASVTAGSSPVRDSAWAWAS